MYDDVDKQIDKCILSIKWLMIFLGLIGSGFAAIIKYSKFILELFGSYGLNLIIILDFVIMALIVIIIIVDFLTIRKLNLKDRRC